MKTNRKQFMNNYLKIGKISTDDGKNNIDDGYLDLEFDVDP